MKRRWMRTAAVVMTLILVMALGACTPKEQQDVLQNLADYAQEQLQEAQAQAPEETQAQDVPETEEPEATETEPAVSETDSAASVDGYVYTSSLYGFTIVMPKDWEEKCEIVEEDMCVYFYSVANRFISYGDVEYEAGRLFYITVPEDDMKQDNGEYYFPSYQIIGQYNGAAVLVVYPTDVQCDIEDEAKTKEYTQMYEQVPEILKTITFG